MTQAEISAAMARETPLYATTEKAVKLFSRSRTTLYMMRKKYPDFRALTIKTGREVLFDVPGVYAWFQKFGGGEMEL